MTANVCLATAILCSIPLFGRPNNEDKQQSGGVRYRYNFCFKRLYLTSKSLIHFKTFTRILIQKYYSKRDET